VQQLTPLAAQAGQYPFLKVLTPVLEKLKELIGKPYTWYLTELTRQEDALLDLKEGVIDPVRKFMSGPQKEIYEQAMRFLKDHESNINYLSYQPSVISNQKENTDGCLLTADGLRALLADPECFKGNCMQQVKTQVETLREKVAAQIEAERTKAKETVTALKGRLCAMAEFGALNGGQQEQIIRPFDEFAAVIDRQTLIAVIRDTLHRFEESDYQRHLSLMTTWAQPRPYTEPKPDPEPSQVTERKSGPVEPEPRIEYVSSRAVKVSFNKAWLANEADVDRYLESMREALLDEIRKGKRIQI
jgi:hypothetical protein